VPIKQGRGDTIVAVHNIILLSYATTCGTICCLVSGGADYEIVAQVSAHILARIGAAQNPLFMLHMSPLKHCSNLADDSVLRVLVEDLWQVLHLPMSDIGGGAKQSPWRLQSRFPLVVGVLQRGLFM
jgi:hypothetical protein